MGIDSKNFGERKVIFIGGIIIVAIALLAFGAVQADAATIAVDDDSGAAYTSIQAAIDAASSGDTIEVAAGTYYEVITIDKAVSIVGSGVATYGGTGSGTGNWTGGTLVTRDPNVGGQATNQIVHITADGVSMTQLTVDGRYGFDSGTRQTCNYGIMVAAADASLSDMDVLDVTNNAIELNNADDAVLSNILTKRTVYAPDYYSDFDYGLRCVDSEGLELTGFTAENVHRGVVVFQGYNGGTLEDLTVIGNGEDGGYGIEFYTGDYEGDLTFTFLGSHDYSGVDTGVYVSDGLLTHDIALSVDPMASFDLHGVTEHGGERLGSGSVPDIDTVMADMGLTQKTSGPPDYYDYPVFVDDDWQKSSDGDTVGSGYLFGYNAFASIQEGINAVATGGTVHVLDGTYNESITINTSLTLLGAQAGVDPTVEGRKSGDESIIDSAGIEGIEIDAGSVTIDGFTVTNASHNGIATPNDGVDRNENTIVNNILSNNGWNGVAIYNSDDNTIENNLMTGNDRGTGLFVDHSDKNNIENNLITDNANRGYDYDAGIRIGNSDGNKITGNTLSGQYQGITLGYAATNTIITNNTITNNDRGIFVRDKGTPSTASGSEAHYNNIVGNREYDVYSSYTDETFDATNNWWGTTAHGDIVSKIEGDVEYSPWLNAPYPDGEPMTGALQMVKVNADPQSLVANGENTTTITATVLNDGGKPMSGIDLSFSSQSGTLSSGSATTGENGKATVELTAPSEPNESTVKATIEGASAATTVFFQEEGGPDVEGSSSQVIEGGTQESTMDSRDETGTSVTVRKTEEGTDQEVSVTVAKFTDNPQGDKALNVGPGGYLDVHVDNTDALEQVTVRIYLDPWPEEPTVKYWNEDQQVWVTIDDAVPFPDEGYIEVTIGPDTDPNLSALSGLPMAGGGLDVEYIQVQNAGWSMVQAPLKPEGEYQNPAQVFQGITPQSIWHYDPGAGEDGEGQYLYAGQAGFQIMSANQGSWIHLSEADAPNSFKVAGVYSGKAEIVLENPGWHQVGPPMDYGWSDIGVTVEGEDIMTVAAQASGPSSPHWMSKFVWSYDTEAGEYTAYEAGNSSFTMEKGKAYWVKTRVEDVMLVVPHNAPPSVPTSTQSTRQVNGIPMSSTKADKLDVPNPPAPPKPLVQPNTDLVVSAMPNPATNTDQVTFRVFGKDVERVKVSVFDTSGETIFQSGYQNGTELTWNMTNKDGSPVANGLYLFTVEARQDGKALTSNAETILILK